MSITKVKLNCFSCGIEFERNASEHKRNEKAGMKAFCNQKCCNAYWRQFVPKPKPEQVKYCSSFLIPSNRLDEYSPFKYYIRNIKIHNKHECNVTLQDLKSQWEKQKGVCPYTGWDLVPRLTTKVDKNNNTKTNPRFASLDRIDSSKDYNPDNIQFVSYIANVAKNCYTEAVLIEFCKAVASHTKL
jgi:hypothetical protein